MEDFIKLNRSDLFEIKVDLHENSIIVNEIVSGNEILQIEFPFKLAKIPPQFLELDDELEYVVLFKNAYFSEFDVCELRLKNGQSERMGYIFNPRIIFNSDSDFIYKKDLYLRIAIFRAFVALIRGVTSLPPKEVSNRGRQNFIFDDFYNDGVLVGVFPFECGNNFEQGIDTGLLFNLYLYGFYVLNNLKDHDLVPPQIVFQEIKFNSLQFQKSTFRKYLNIIKVDQNVVNNNYCKYFIENLVKDNGDEIAKFHQIYSLVEIFKDLVLRKELIVRICSVINPEITGYGLHSKVLEISKDSYTVKKLFTKYSHSDSSYIYETFFEIFEFLLKYRDEGEFKEIDEFPILLYYLRNIIFHDIQFYFTEKEHLALKSHFNRCVIKSEYVIIDSLTNSAF